MAKPHKPPSEREGDRVSGGRRLTEVTTPNKLRFTLSLCSTLRTPLNALTSLPLSLRFRSHFASALAPLPLSLRFRSHFASALASLPLSLRFRSHSAQCSHFASALTPLPLSLCFTLSLRFRSHFASALASLPLSLCFTLSLRRPKTNDFAVSFIIPLNPTASKGKALKKRFSHAKYARFGKCKAIYNKKSHSQPIVAENSI